MKPRPDEDIVDRFALVFHKIPDLRKITPLDFVRRLRLAGIEISEPAKPPRGRPRLEDQAAAQESVKPWQKLRMSRRTYFRREAERRQKEAK